MKKKLLAGITVASMTFCVVENSNANPLDIKLLYSLYSISGYTYYENSIHPSWNNTDSYTHVGNTPISDSASSPGEPYGSFASSSASLFGASVSTGNGVMNGNSGAEATATAITVFQPLVNSYSQLITFEQLTMNQDARVTLKDLTTGELLWEFAYGGWGGNPDWTFGGISLLTTTCSFLSVHAYELTFFQYSAENDSGDGTINYGYMSTSSFNVAPTPTPEPSTIILLGAGLAGIILAHRGKNPPER